MNPRHGEVWSVDMGMTAKTRPARLVLAFPNGFRAQREREANKNNDDSRPRASTLFSAFSGLKDGAHLTAPVLDA